jgi:L-type amino acid transporter 6
MSFETGEDERNQASSPFVNASNPSSRSPSIAELEPSSAGPKALQLTLVHSLAIVISMQIGSGIFAAPTQVSQSVASPGIAIIVWITGGVLAWTGASSFIELGLTIPKNGGMQEYLQACYGDFMAFLFTWTLVTIIQPCSFAIISTVFANHLCGAILPASLLSTWLIKFVALLGLSFITFLNCLGTKVGPNMAKGFLFMKISAVISILLVALFAVVSGKAQGVTNSNSGWFGSYDIQNQESEPSRIGGFVTALFGALYCYGGWETVQEFLLRKATLN